jgi:CheY-like chemotaxis protein
MMELQSVTILLVDDDVAHSTLIERNLRRGGVTNPIIKFDNGLDALDYLFNKGKFADHVRPAHLLVLLDLNMPEVDGFQVLKAMKDDAECRVVPVIILTTTNDPHEVQRCYDFGCNNFVTKPVDPKQFAKTIQDLGLFIDIMSAPCCQ